MHRLGGLLHARLSAECAKYVDAAVDALGKEVGNRLSSHLALSLHSCIRMIVRCAVILGLRGLSAARGGHLAGPVRVPRHRQKHIHIPRQVSSSAGILLCVNFSVLTFLSLSLTPRMRFSD